MEMTGLEPVTPCLQSRCSSQLSYIPGWAGRIGCTAQPELYAFDDQSHRTSRRLRAAICRYRSTFGRRPRRPRIERREQGEPEMPIR